MSIQILLSLMFLKIGAISYGGSTAMIPAIYQNLKAYGLIDYDSFSNMIVVSQMTPGTISINLATFVGLSHGGLLLATILTLAVTVPSVIVMLVAIKLWYKMKGNKELSWFLEGLKSAGLGLILTTVYIMATTIDFFTDKFSIISIALMTISFLWVGVFKKNPIIILIISGITGSIFLV